MPGTSRASNSSRHNNPRMTPHLPIYMDYGATTPCDPRVVDAMIPWLREHFGNPASRSHAWGWEAEEAVEKAREQVAKLIGADPREIVWTSGATESNNLALKGAAHFYGSRGKHLVTVKTEHKAVLDTMRELERQGFEVTYLDVQPDGLLDLEKFKAALRKDTVLVSVMLVNNEIGVIQDVAAIGAMCRERGIVFHVDAAQGTGKVAIDLAKLPVDLMSLASHKTYGPKGIGALYVRRKPRVRLEAQMHGGGHERGMRSGTLPTHQCVGMGLAFEIARTEMGTELERIRMGRFGVVGCNLLGLIMCLPLFLRREPVPMMLPAIKATPVAMVALLGGVLGTSLAIPALPPELSVFLPTLALLPLAIASATSIKT